VTKPSRSCFPKRDLDPIDTIGTILIGMAAVAVTVGAVTIMIHDHIH
jgi:hypothetical protein